MASSKGDEQSEYTCGNCLYAIYYLVSDGPPDACPECGYRHKERRVDDIDSEFKLDLTKY